MGPETVEPSPYSMENVPLFFVPVDGLDAVYLLLLLQVELVQDELGTHKSDEPVSKSRFTVTAGVPTLTGTTYSVLHRLLGYMSSGQTMHVTHSVKLVSVRRDKRKKGFKQTDHSEPLQQELLLHLQ